MDVSREMLDGKIYAMTQPSVNHGKTKGNIFNIFENYLENSTCEALLDGTAVYLDEANYVIPDFMVVCNRSTIKEEVCNRSTIKEDGIYGAPNLIAEVLSPSTAYKDRGYKKELYERKGVQEYWIIDPKNKTVEVYVLKDGKYHFEATYVHYEEKELQRMTDEERDRVVMDFRTSVFPELSVSIERVFRKLI